MYTLTKLQKQQKKKKKKKEKTAEETRFLCRVMEPLKHLQWNLCKKATFETDF